MRRLVPLGLLLAMTGCGQYASSPFVGFGGFIGDTHTVYRNPNRPPGNAENMLRVMGQPVTDEPLTPEPGNVWPGPLPPQQTLQDIEKSNNDSMLRPGEELNLGRPRGSGNPAPGLFQPNPSNTPAAQGDPAVPPITAPPPQPPPRSPTIQTGTGAGTLNNGGSVSTYTAPNGATGIVVPNGNGTSTLIGPDGGVQTVPTPR